MPNYTNLSRAEKIMLVIYEMSAKKKQHLKFEDIVVSVFKKFPEDFHLRGYPNFPDSGDLVHKPLYDFRKKGFLEANSKVFRLTERGLVFAEKLSGITKGKDLNSKERLTRYADQEISRIESTEGYSLFLSGEQKNITDTDFYNYLGVTARTSRNNFLGRLQTVEGALKELATQKQTGSSKNQVWNYHNFLLEKFSSVIKLFTANH